MTPMWTLRTFGLVALVLSSMVSGQEFTCTDEEKLESQRRHEQCIETVEARQTATGSGARILQLCQRLEEQIHKCGEHFANCLSPNDLRLVKDAQISAFTKFLDIEGLSHLYRECEVVKEFQRSNRKPFKATELCKVDQIERKMNKREDCVQTQSLILKSEMQKLSPMDKSSRNQLLCDFVNKTMEECSLELRDCYSAEEFRKFKESSYSLLVKFLNHFELDFDLGECENLATPVPLIELSASASTMVSTTLISLILFRVGLMLTSL